MALALIFSPLDIADSTFLVTTGRFFSSPRVISKSCSVRPHTTIVFSSSGPGVPAMVFSLLQAAADKVKTRIRISKGSFLKNIFVHLSFHEVYELLVQFSSDTRPKNQLPYCSSRLTSQQVKRCPNSSALTIICILPSPPVFVFNGRP